MSQVAAKLWAILSFDARIGRRNYLLAALAAVIVKWNVDREVATAMHIEWTPAMYFAFPSTSVGALAQSGASHAATFLAIALPFLWLGTALVVARLRDAGQPLWLVFLFFMPAINVVFGLLLAAWPPNEARTAVEGLPDETFLQRIVPHGIVGSAVAAIIVTLALGLPALLLGSQVLGEYGWGLFVAVPFAMGTISALVYGAREQRNLGECMLVALAAVTLAGVALLAFAWEGVVCLIMAAPLAGSVAIIGGMFGWVLQRRPTHGLTLTSMLVLALASPAIMGAAVLAPADAPVYAVTTSVDVDAPPATVWRHVIAFPDLPPPTELPFRYGVAYPQRARIVGRGPGAIRYCEFSTGAFVEPITVWQTNRRLAFDVTRNPQPMRELTPYPNVDTPHLHGYMESLHGQFVLEPLPGNRTRLVGTTWYRHHLWPADYWRLWSDGIIHQIHTRVLNHIARLSSFDVKGH